MTTSNATILDYASPGAKSALRVGSRSLLRVQRAADELRIVETLEDHAQAIGAILFAWLAMTPMICLAAVATTDVMTEPGLAVLAWILAWILPLAGALTTYGVIESTWGRTILIVNRSLITLRFVSPLRRLREHRWGS